MHRRRIGIRIADGLSDDVYYGYEAVDIDFDFLGRFNVRSTRVVAQRKLERNLGAGFEINGLIWYEVLRQVENPTEFRILSSVQSQVREQLEEDCDESVS